MLRKEPPTYSEPIHYDDYLYTGGQIPLTPEEEIVEGDVRKQTQQVLKNIQAFLKEEGSDLDHVIETTVFLKNIRDFEVVNQVYESYFQNHQPARTFIEASCLPKGALIEIECIAKKIGS